MKNFLKNFVIKILTWEARLALHHYSPKIIAITGSVGKTSTKDAIFDLISKKFNARKSEKSFNSEIGVPLTILGLNNAWSNPFKWIWNIKLGFWKIFFSRNYPRILVLEVGADRPGDIKKIASWLCPNIAVITALAEVPVHVENFASPEEIYREKRRLVEALEPNGIAVLNADDEKVLAMKKKTGAKKILFGLNGIVDVLGSIPSIIYDDNKPIGISFRIDTLGKSFPFEINGGLGVGHEYAVLAATAVALNLGMNILEIAEAAKKIKTPMGRMKILEGIKKTMILDDTYNSSPIAVESALNTLKEIKTNGRKIAALGDMLELGQYSEREHKRIGKLVAGIAHMLIAVGEKSKWIADGALSNGMPSENIRHFDNSREAGVYVQNILEEGDIILVKGSQGMRMERLVEQIMAEPERAPELLVRQDKEWRKI